VSEFGVWELTAPAAPVLPALAGNHDCDVAIVGAGYTGLSTALHLAEAGVHSTVIEAQAPGWGASGRNTGWVEPNWWMKRPADIVQRFGPDLGDRLTRWVAAGPDLLMRWITRHGLRAEFEQCGLVLATDNEATARAMAAEAAEWQALGVNNRFLSAPEIPAYVPTDRYRGAMLLGDGGTLNPLALSLELARACSEQGVQLFERTPVTSISGTGTGWRLGTPRGTVHARRLVLATDAYTGSLWPELRAAYATWRVAVIASAPYAALDTLLPRTTPVADMNLANILTLRRAAGSRIASSTYAPVRRGLSPADIAGPFMRKFRRVFPRLPEPHWEQVHYGEIGLSRDMIPRLCNIGPGAWTAYGYSGTGINQALLLGGELAQLVATDEPRATLFPVTPLAPMPLYRLIGAGLRYLHAPLSRHLISRVA
jgi:glycine/D-amino acid oxidase-like deaminating enzyme